MTSPINREPAVFFIDESGAKHLVNIVAESDARIIAKVVNRSDPQNPFSRSADPEWKVHARITAQLIQGNINQGQQAVVVVDNRSTKPNVSFGDTIRGMTNHRLGAPRVVAALAIDSRASDLLQVADLMAGAIANQRRTPEPATINHKARIARDLATALSVPGFDQDRRGDRVNILTAGHRQETCE